MTRYVPEPLLKLSFNQWLQIATILVIGTFITILLNYTIYPALRRRAARKHSAIQRIIFKSLRGETIIWMFAIMVTLILDIMNQADIISTSNFKDITVIIQILVLFSILWFFKDVVEEGVDYYVRKGKIPRTSIFVNVIKYSLIVLFIVLILDQFGFSLTGLITALGIGGLAIALALQDTLSNFFAGLTILTSGQVKNGDYIEVESGEEGYVQDITWRTTTIETLDQELVVIPNYKLANSTIKNTSRPQKELLLRVKFGVDYSSDLKLVEQVTLDVANNIIHKHEGGIKDYKPRLFYTNFGDSSIDLDVLMRVQSFDYRRILRHHFIMELSEAYAEHDITIPFPIRTVKMDKE